MPNRAKDFFRYLPVSEREEQWGLYVTAGGFNAIAPGDQYPRPGHPRGYAFSMSQGRLLPEYQVLYITRGEGEFESKPSGLKKVAAGSVILLFPGVWHRYRPCPDVGWDEYWISYNGPYVERLVRARVHLAADARAEDGPGLPAPARLPDPAGPAPFGTGRLPATVGRQRHGDIWRPHWGLRAVKGPAAGCTNWSAGRSRCWKPRSRRFPR